MIGKIVRYFVLAVCVAVFSVGCFALGVSINDREPPIRIDSATALSQKIPQGGTLGIALEVYRTRLCTGEAKRWLYDAAGVKHSIPQFTAGEAPTKVGPDTYTRTITIPDAAAIGPAYYQVEFDYYCNPLHWLGYPIHVVAPPIRFEITPSTSLVPFQTGMAGDF